MRIQQMRKAVGGTRGTPAARNDARREDAPGWLREFASGIAASNLLRHGAGVPGSHGARVCPGRTARTGSPAMPVQD